MKIIEIGTGYTSIPAQVGAATEIVVEELTRSFLKLGQDVIIVDIKDKNRAASDLPIKEACMPQFLSRTDTKLGIVHKLKRVLYSLSLTYKLHQLLRKEKQRVVLHFHNQYNSFFYLKFTPKYIRRKAQISYTVHSYIWQGEWNVIKDIVKKRYFQEITSCQKADKIFVLNEITKRHFIEHLNIDKNKIELIANGVNTLNYYPLSEEKEIAIKKKLGLEGKIVFFQAGSVCERKNQQESIRLLLPLMKENKNIVFVYAGGVIDSEYKEKIERLISDAGIVDRVKYAGELLPGARLNEYYNVADFFLLPSISEGFSLVVLEAMSAALPVFVNINSGLQLPNDGKSGCIGYANDKDFILKAEELINDREKLILQKENARMCIEQNYSWNSVAKEYLKRML